MVLSLLGTNYSWGQYTNQGNFIIGSTAGFSSAQSRIEIEGSNGNSRKENPSSIQLNITPAVGYFIGRNFALGIGLDYTFGSITEETNGEKDRIEDSDLLFGPFARAYLPLSNQKFFFIQADFGFGNSRDDKLINNQRQTIRTNIFSMGLGSGLTIISNDAMGIEALFKYNYARSDFDTDVGGVQQNTVTNRHQFDFSVGIQFYFASLRRAGN